MDMISIGCGALDVRKDDLTRGMDYSIAKRLRALQARPDEAARLRNRVVKIDFSSRDPVSSYNLLARWPGSDADFFRILPGRSVTGASFGE